MLSFFDRSHRGRCEEVALATGLSMRTVSRRLNELTKVGVLSVLQAKTFPSFRQYRLPDASRAIAHAAASLLTEMRGEESVLCEVAFIRKSDRTGNNPGRPK